MSKKVIEKISNDLHSQMLSYSFWQKNYGGNIILNLI
jgi:hypothetical protein